MKKIILFATVALFIFSCNPEKRMQRRCSKCPQHTEQISHDTIKETVRDTTILFQADTASFFALIKCDSTNHAYLAQIKTLTTEGIKTKFIFLHDTLQIETTIDSAKVYLAVKEKYQSHQETQTIIKKDTIYRTPAWIWFLMGAAVILFFIAGWAAKKYF